MTGISVAAKSRCRKPVQLVRRYLHTTPTGLLAVEMFKECARQATPPYFDPKYWRAYFRIVRHFG
jgi:hypothetical protein